MRRELELATFAGGLACVGLALLVVHFTLGEETRITQLQARLDENADLLAGLDAAFRLEIRQLTDRLNEADTILDELGSELGRQEMAIAELRSKSTEVESALIDMRESVSHLHQDYRTEISALRGRRAKIASASLIIREIESAMEEGRNFVALVERLGLVLEEDARIVELAADLAPFAGGLSTIEQLDRELVAIEVAAIDSMANSFPNWVDRTMGNMRQLVVIEGHESPQSLHELLPLARKQLQNGDLTVAASLVEPHVLEDPRVASWLEGARSLLAAQALVAAANRHLNQLLSRQG